MGFTNNAGGNYATWASFADGKIVLRSKEPREGFTARVNKIGNTVYEQRHNAFEGYLTEISSSDNDYGSQFLFKFEDASGSYILTDRLDGSYARAIISHLAVDSFDPTQPVTLTPWRMDDPRGGDKYIVGCNVQQGGKKLPRKYCSSRTPEEKRNGAQPFPEIQMVRINGKMQMDSSPVVDILTAEAEKINARLSSVPMPAKQKAQPAGTSAEAQAWATSDAKPRPVMTDISQVREAATSGDVPDGLPF